MDGSFYALQVQESVTVRADNEADLARRVIEAAPGRDPRAEEALYRLLAPRARLYGLKHLRDAHAAADLAQDVMLLTLDRLRRGEVREPDHIASFVLGTCRQLVIDRKRGVQRRERIVETYVQDLDVAECVEPLGLDTGQLSRCLGLLPERERTVIVMTFFDDSDANEVAQALAISAANARVIRHRAIDRLRTCMDREGIHDA
jgi:RNA polymerase sigma-70 factor (ECF subfamily)